MSSMSSNGEEVSHTSVEKILDEFSSVLDSFKDPQKRAFFVEVLNQHPISDTLSELQEQTPLKYVARIGDITYELVEHFLNEGSNLEEYGNPMHTHSRRRTALHVAVESGAFLIAQLLLDHGAKVNSKDADGRTPLHLAAMSFQKPMIMLLLDYGASRDAKDLDGRTPIDLIQESMWGKPIEECVTKVADSPVKIKLENTLFDMNSQPMNAPFDMNSQPMNASFDYAQMQYWNNASMRGVPPSFNYPPMYYLPMQPNWNNAPMQVVPPSFNYPPMYYVPMQPNWNANNFNSANNVESPMTPPQLTAPNWDANNFSNVNNFSSVNNVNDVRSPTELPQLTAPNSNSNSVKSAKNVRSPRKPPKKPLQIAALNVEVPPQQLEAVNVEVSPQQLTAPMFWGQKATKAQVVKQEPVSTIPDEIPFDPVTRMYIIKPQKKVLVQESDLIQELDFADDDLIVDVVQGDDVVQEIDVVQGGDFADDESIVDVTGF